MSTGRLLAALAGAVIAIVAGTAISIAATGGGPVPRRESLATAVHNALVAPPVSAFSARITFTNHLIDSSAVQGTDPLLTGGSGRLWYSSRAGLRIEIQSTNGDAQIVARPGRLWAYDPTSDTVYELALPTGADHGSRMRTGTEHVPTIADIESALQRVAGHLTVSGAVPGDLGGRPTYTVHVAPAAGGGLLGGVALSWDAVRGVPLRFDLYTRGDSAPVIELRATDVSYGAVASSVFALEPPAGAHVVHISLPAAAPGSASHARGAHAITGVSAVAAHLAFRLDAPAALAGLTRSSVTLVGHGADAGALITYGQGLGGLAVLERPGPGARVTAPAGDRPGLSLPGVSVGGASAQELPTALGTVLQFARGGVSYTLAGSLPAATVERAARGL
jgi:outer membrane lipoprotein-sorting protein